MREKNKYKVVRSDGQTIVVEASVVEVSRHTVTFLDENLNVLASFYKYNQVIKEN